MTAETIIPTALLETLPPEWGFDLMSAIQADITASKKKIVILDDDPTGTQTSRDIPVLTHWSVAALQKELLEPSPAFFILTNSRSLPENQAVLLAKEIGTNLRIAAHNVQVRLVLISRSDSTLRGHFPCEVDAMALALGKSHLPYLIIPFFLEGGRFTINNIHYVQDKGSLIPAAQTAFAQDASFGFRHSNLQEWVAEKTGGRLAANDVIAIDLTDIRLGGPETVKRILCSVPDGQACVVNAASYRDIQVVVAGLLAAERDGHEFLCRTAASFVQTRIGLKHQSDLLSPNILSQQSALGGLFIIGSYVEKTTQQLASLLEIAEIFSIELSVTAVLDPTRNSGEIENAAREVSSAIASGKDTVIFTSRSLTTGCSSEECLKIGKTVSHSLIQIVQALSTQPRYLVAKGGITSSDIATAGLGTHRAIVIGQALPGVPVWRLGPETRYPGMSYIIFPGNVGNRDSLRDLAKKLRNAFEKG